VSTSEPRTSLLCPPARSDDDQSACLALERLRQTARQEIDRHVNAYGHCVACGERFPCDRAVLADMALGLF
jgi:RNA polymerase-binding transcription factor DksA